MCPQLPALPSASKFAAVCPIPSTFLRLGPKSPSNTRFHVLRSNCHHHQIELFPVPYRLPAMPYIDLLHPFDAVSIWYTASSRLGTVNSLQPDKPTIVMLHPLYLNSSWLWGQMDDPRLNSAFNMIAFDTRTSGKSMSTPSGMYDTWVQAADLALCFQVCWAPSPPRFPCSDFARVFLSASSIWAVSPPTTRASCWNRNRFRILRTEIRYFVRFPLNPAQPVPLSLTQLPLGFRKCS